MRKLGLLALAATLWASSAAAGKTDDSITRAFADCVIRSKIATTAADLRDRGISIESTKAYIKTIYGEDAEMLFVDSVYGEWKDKPKIVLKYISLGVCTDMYLLKNLGED